MTNLTAQGAPELPPLPRYSFSIKKAEHGMTWAATPDPDGSLCLYSEVCAYLADRQARQAAPEAPRQPAFDPVWFCPHPWGDSWHGIGADGDSVTMTETEYDDAVRLGAKIGDPGIALAAPEAPREPDVAKSALGFLPCPFCGSHARFSFGNDGEVVNVRCSEWGNGCMGAGPNEYSRDKAREGWNRRIAALAASEAEAVKVEAAKLLPGQVAKEILPLNSLIDWLEFRAQKSTHPDPACGIWAVAVRAAMKSLATPSPQAAEPVPVEAVSEDTKRDAARYRWMMEHCGFEPGERVTQLRFVFDEEIRPGFFYQLQGAIDAAIAASPSSAGEPPTSEQLYEQITGRKP